MIETFDMWVHELIFQWLQLFEIQINGSNPSFGRFGSNVNLFLKWKTFRNFQYTAPAYQFLVIKSIVPRSSILICVIRENLPKSRSAISKWTLIAKHPFYLVCVVAEAWKCCLLNKLPQRNENTSCLRNVYRIQIRYGFTQEKWGAACARRFQQILRWIQKLPNLMWVP